MSAAPAGLLVEIVENTRKELAERKCVRPQPELEAALSTRATRPAGAFAAALSQAPIALIAEVKRQAPSTGVLHAQADVAATVCAYERGGASAASILTEAAHFGGSLTDLREARQASALPLLRKDFIVDRYQLLEAADAGADAVLLIVAALEQAELEQLHAAASQLGLSALVEVHDRAELERALAAGAVIVGINNRDLRDFSVDFERTFTLLERIPDGVITVSESGISEHGQVQRLAAAGVDAVLVGSALMRSGQPQREAEELLAGSARAGKAAH